MKLKRWQQPNIQEALENSRIVILAGARQCGKTTVASHLVSQNDSFTFRTLDDIAMLTSARADPHGFLSSAP